MVPPWHDQDTAMLPAWYPLGTAMTPPCLRTASTTHPLSPPRKQTFNFQRTSGKRTERKRTRTENDRSGRNFRQRNYQSKHFNNKRFNKLAASHRPSCLGTGAPVASLSLAPPPTLGPHSSATRTAPGPPPPSHSAHLGSNNLRRQTRARETVPL